MNPFFFGYGSLVNRGTHNYFDAQNARANGWRRGWRRSPYRALSFLTAIPSPGDYIDGLIAGVPDGDWAALDLREQAYTRLDATHQIDHESHQNLDVAIYAIGAEAHSEPDGDNPILLSYVDVVLQGYAQEFGPQGVNHFIETTSGWHVPVIDDRAAPIYPRAPNVISGRARNGRRNAGRQRRAPRPVGGRAPRMVWRIETLEIHKQKARKMQNTNQTIDAYYAALKSGDRAAITALLSDDIRVDYYGPDGLFPWQGAWVGEDRFFAFLDAVAENLTIDAVTPMQRVIARR